MKSLLRDYVAYNLWANELICQQVKGLDLNIEVASSFPSLQLSMLHIWDAQEIWLKRLQGSSLNHFPSSSLEKEKVDACALLLKSSQEWLDFLDGLKELDLQSDYAFFSTSGNEYRQKKVESILHCMNHGTYHRGQIVTILHQMGQKNIVGTDYVRYRRQFM